MDGKPGGSSALHPQAWGSKGMWYLSLRSHIRIFFIHMQDSLSCSEGLHMYISMHILLLSMCDACEHM